MKALIIGGTGLISGAITRELKRKGHEVTVFHRGRRPLEVAGVSEIIGDRYDRPAFEAAVGARRFDAVFDLISFNAKDCASALRAFKGKVKHFIHCSTVCAVGVPTTQVPCDESEPYRPISGYGRGKAEAERFWLSAWRKSRFPVTIFRPSHTYGPGAAWVLGTFVDDWDKDCALINRMRSGKHVLVGGDGEQLWQSCYVDDAAVGFVAAARRKRTFGQVYNICGAEAVTWNEYYRRLGEGLGVKAKLAHLPSSAIFAGAPDSATGFWREIGQFHGAYSNKKILSHIPEFKPKTSLQQGIRLHWNWLKSKNLLKLAPKRAYEDRLVRLALSLPGQAKRSVR